MSRARVAIAALLAIGFLGSCSFINDFSGFAFDGPSLDASAGCTDVAQCDDQIACTRDACRQGECLHEPDPTVCDAADDGTCRVGFGCEYPGCSMESCTSGPCQVARCNGAECVLTTECDENQTCCQGACVPAGCADEHDCTVDFCGATGCEHTAVNEVCDDDEVCTDDVCDPVAGCQQRPNSEDCDDAVFCNGADTCSGGSCSVHEGEPCSGESVCDEAGETCSGCVDENDCPDPELGEWSACDYEDVCDTSAVQVRTVTAYACSSSRPRTCVLLAPTTEERPCTRVSDGVICEESCFETECGPTVGSGCFPLVERYCDRRRCDSEVCGASEREDLSPITCGTCELSVGRDCIEGGRFGICQSDCMCDTEH